MMNPHDDALVEGPVIDAALIARGLGLELEVFRSLMREGRIRTLSERGVGEDLGRFRLTFWWQKARFQIVTDASGNPLQDI